MPAKPRGTGRTLTPSERVFLLQQQGQGIVGQTRESPAHPVLEIELQVGGGAGRDTPDVPNLGPCSQPSWHSRGEACLPRLKGAFHVFTQNRQLARFCRICIVPFWDTNISLTSSI